MLTCWWLIRAWAAAKQLATFHKLRWRFQHCRKQCEPFKQLSRVEHSYLESAGKLRRWRVWEHISIRRMLGALAQESITNLKKITKQSMDDEEEWNQKSSEIHGLLNWYCSDSKIQLHTLTYNCKQVLSLPNLCIAQICSRRNTILIQVAKTLCAAYERSAVESPAKQLIVKKKWFVKI